MKITIAHARMSRSDWQRNWKIEAIVGLVCVLFIVDWALLLMSRLQKELRARVEVAVAFTTKPKKKVFKRTLTA